MSTIKKELQFLFALPILTGNQTYFSVCAMMVCVELHKLTIGGWLPKLRSTF